jgi:hypothetical protein
VYIQCVVHSRPSSRPASPSRNAPEQTLSTRAPRGVGPAQRVENLERDGHPYRQGGDRDEVRVVHRAEVGMGYEGEARPGTDWTPVGGADGEVVCREAVPWRAEDLAEHAQLERGDLVQRDDRDPVECHVTRGNSSRGRKSREYGNPATVAHR